MTAMRESITLRCGVSHTDFAPLKAARKAGRMASLKFNALAIDDQRMGGLVRPAVEKFAGDWLACLLVMARGNIFDAFSFDHVVLATVCGTVGAVVAVVLLAQMDRTVDSVMRQATISAVVTLVGDVFALPSHFPPQWAEPLV